MWEISSINLTIEQKEFLPTISFKRENENKGKKTTNIQIDINNLVNLYNIIIDIIVSWTKTVRLLDILSWKMKILISHIVLVWFCLSYKQM